MFIDVVHTCACKGKSKVMMRYEQIKKYNCAGFIFEPWLELLEWCMSQKR
jgi:hypothetical protein